MGELLTEETLPDTQPEPPSVQLEAFSQLQNF